MLIGAPAHRLRHKGGRDGGGCDTGSALMLMPAAVLVLFLLASLAVDSALVWTAQRELANRAAAAANDIAATAIDDEHFYRTGTVLLDAQEAEAIVADHLGAESGGALRSIAVSSLDTGGRSVRVSLSARATAIFAPALPGLRGDRVVRATAVAETTPGP